MKRVTLEERAARRDRIYKLRRNGVSFGAIAAVVGVTERQAQNLYDWEKLNYWDPLRKKYRVYSFSTLYLSPEDYERDQLTVRDPQPR